MEFWFVMPWYVFNPSGPSPHPIGNMAFYDAPQILPPDCSGPKISLCAIYAEDDQGEPILLYISIIQCIRTSCFIMVFTCLQCIILNEHYFYFEIDNFNVWFCLWF